MAVHPGVAEALQALADYGPPPRAWAALVAWAQDSFGVSVGLSLLLPLGLAGVYCVLALPVPRRVILVRPAAADMWWTLLHELGHHLTGDGFAEGVHLRADGYYAVDDPAELAADNCAAALAIAEGDLLAHCRAGGTVEEAAAVFGVPQRAVILRCVQVGVVPARLAAEWGLEEWR